MKDLFICKIEAVRYFKDNHKNQNSEKNVTCKAYNDIFKAIEAVKDEIGMHDVHRVTFDSWNDGEIRIYNDCDSDDWSIYASINKALYEDD